MKYRILKAKRSSELEVLMAVFFGLGYTFENLIGGPFRSSYSYCQAVQIKPEDVDKVYAQAAKEQALTTEGADSVQQASADIS